MQNETLPTQPPGAAPQALGFCLYRSLGRPGLEKSALAQILAKSAENNRAAGLTGCLHHEDGLFFQWLEGPRPNLFRLIDRLQEDDRHVNMTILDQGLLEQRLFPDWKMHFSDRAAASLLDWLSTRPTGLDQAKEIGDFFHSIGQRSRNAA